MPGVGPKWPPPPTPASRFPLRGRSLRRPPWWTERTVSLRPLRLQGECQAPPSPPPPPQPVTPLAALRGLREPARSDFHFFAGGGGPPGTAKGPPPPAKKCWQGGGP